MIVSIALVSLASRLAIMSDTTTTMDNATIDNVVTVAQKLEIPVRTFSRNFPRDQRELVLGESALASIQELSSHLRIESAEHAIEFMAKWIRSRSAL